MSRVTPEIYTLSLHDARPICIGRVCANISHQCLGAILICAYCRKTSVVSCRRYRREQPVEEGESLPGSPDRAPQKCRSEEHTSELQSLTNLVCRLLLDKTSHF